MTWRAFLPELEERFLRYVQIDTQSDEANPSTPSTVKQLDLLRLLAGELRQMGANDIVLTDYACVLATLPGNQPDAPTVAFLAHVDTSADYSGANVRPIVHRHYDGAPISLPDNPAQTLTAANSRFLAGQIGEDLVTASGSTLLGADDKAGVAIMMALATHLLAHPDLPRGDVRLCFTPDEEVGRGTEGLRLEDLAADVAYTLDGAETGEITYETFSADKAVVTITGVSIHPGDAKDRMVNALPLAAELLLSLPQDNLTPATTSGREGFIHPYKVHGSTAQVEIHFILRDFERDGLAAHGARLQAACEQLQAAHPGASVACAITAQYRNMRYWLENNMRPVELAIQAIEQAGIPPVIRPIRGGTDGSRLTERGLPTPNLFTGMHNIHGPLEYVSLQDMARATQVCLNLVQLWGQETN